MFYQYMVLTRSGNQSLNTNIAMDLASPSASGTGPSIMEKAKANENARLANETWFNKFSDGPILDDLMENFDPWNVYLIEVTTEKNCVKLLTESPGDNPILKNHAKNIQTFFNKPISEDLRDVVLEATAMETYEMLLSLKPDSSAKRVEILKEVAGIDSTDIKAYVIAMQHLQKKLRDIDTSGSHYE